MYTFDEIGSMLDDVADEIPEKYFKGLTGGIYLKPEAKYNDRIPIDRYFVLGEYCYSPILGSSIYFFYGSFMALYVDAAPEEIKSQLRETLKHELQHHIERLAGCNGLEIEDDKFVKEALCQLNSKKRGDCMKNYESHQTRNSLAIGQLVDIVLKKDQPTGKLTRGRIKRILTHSPYHWRGIKVMLDDGQVGRVQKIID